MDYNEIVELIYWIKIRYNQYLQTIRTINFNSEDRVRLKINKRLVNIKVEELNFESFDKEYLTNLLKKYYDLNEYYQTKYKIIYLFDNECQ